jgi:hypothetical protein
MWWALCGLLRCGSGGAIVLYAKVVAAVLVIQLNAKVVRWERKRKRKIRKKRGEGGCDVARCTADITCVGSAPGAAHHITLGQTFADPLLQGVCSAGRVLITFCAVNWRRRGGIGGNACDRRDVEGQGRADNVCCTGGRVAVAVVVAAAVGIVCCC